MARKKILDKVFLLVFSINILFLIIVSFKPAENNISLYKTIYSNYKDSATLYYITNNPYERVLNITFYKYKRLLFIKNNEKL